MPYVSAQYAPPLPPEMRGLAKPGAPARVIAVDDQGVEWHLTEDSQVGDWLRFKAAGGTVREPPQIDPAKAKKGKSDG